LVLLVPEQATFQMERALLDCLGGGRFRARALIVFSEVAFWAFQEAEGQGNRKSDCCNGVCFCG
jgi:ATP-dependent helicase/DNAse subunit B